MVFQQFALLPWRTVKENVAFGLELRRMPKAEIDKIVADKLAMVGLTQWAGKFGHELSGGMQQRVGLARAFATDADILLMDEPFSALDPLIRDKLQDELLLLQKDLKKTIIFVSHDLDEALKLGNRIAILEGGRVVQWGTAEDILLRPADAYVAEFVKHMNPLNVLRGQRADDAGRVAPAARKRSAARSGRPHPRAARRRRPADRRDAGRAPQEPSPRRTRRPARCQRRVDVVVASIDLKMRSAIALRRDSGNPIVLVDDLGRMAGLCGDDEIYRALLQQRKAAGEAGTLHSLDRGARHCERRGKSRDDRQIHCERAPAIDRSAGWIALPLRSSQ